MSTNIEGQYIHNSCCGHNSSATTAMDSFHGTGISLLQHPTSADEGCLVALSSWEVTLAQKLPNFYTDVPPITSSVKRSALPATSVISLKWNDYKKHAEGEYRWLENTRHILEDVELRIYEKIS